MWKRLGVELKRNTMANWVVLTAETCLKPFSDVFLAELLRQAVIHADETVLPERFAAYPQSPVDDLMPWIEEMQKSFRAPDVEH